MTLEYVFTVLDSIEEFSDIGAVYRPQAAGCGRMVYVLHIWSMRNAVYSDNFGAGGEYHDYIHSLMGNDGAAGCDGGNADGEWDIRVGNGAAEE